MRIRVAVFLVLILGTVGGLGAGQPEADACCWNGDICVRVFSEEIVCDDVYDAERDVLLDGMWVFWHGPMEWDEADRETWAGPTGVDGELCAGPMAPGTWQIWVNDLPEWVCATDGAQTEVVLEPCGMVGVDIGLCRCDIPPPEECGPCEGKVTDLTLRYLGTSGARIEVRQKKDKDVIYAGSVAPGEEFSFVGTDKKGTMGTEIEVYVDGSLDVKIHTSCSNAIAPGMTFGSFLVTAGASREGGALCPVDPPIDPPVPPQDECGACDGKITQLTLSYQGTSGVYVEVRQKKPSDVLYAGFVGPGEEFSFVGTDKKGTMGTEIEVRVGVTTDVKIHTSCSNPIATGMTFGSFLVTAGASRNGGALCGR